jgi:hypothetical protein
MTKTDLSVERNILIYYYKEKQLKILKHCFGGGQLFPDSSFWTVALTESEADCSFTVIKIILM